MKYYHKQCVDVESLVEIIETIK